MADGNRLARFGVRHQAVFGILVMQVEHRGDRLGTPAQSAMFHRIGHPLPAQPDLAPIAQATEKLGAGPSWHSWSPCFSDVPDE